MRRRALLAALAAGSDTAGCLTASPGSTTTDEPTTRETGAATDASTGDPATVATCEPSTPELDGVDDQPEDAEFVIRDVEASTSYDRPKTRYLLEPDAFYSEDAVEREREDGSEEIVVVDITGIDDPTVREAIRTAIETGEWRSNELPDGLRETVDRVDFVTGVSTDDTYTHVGVALHEYDVDAPPAVAFDAAVADRYVSPSEPGSIALWLSNRREDTWSVFSGTVPPFGMLRADPVDAPSEFLLWRDYEAEGCFSRSDDGWIRCDIGKYTELPPCAFVVREYAVLPSTTANYPEETVPESPGRYEITGSVGYGDDHGGRSVELSYMVEFELAEP